MAPDDPFDFDYAHRRPLHQQKEAALQVLAEWILRRVLQPHWRRSAEESADGKPTACRISVRAIVRKLEAARDLEDGEPRPHKEVNPMTPDSLHWACTLALRRLDAEGRLTAKTYRMKSMRGDVLEGFEYLPGDGVPRTEPTRVLPARSQ